jgi:hypothetical protein
MWDVGCDQVRSVGKREKQAEQSMKAGRRNK